MRPYNTKNEIGNRYSRLVVIERAEKPIHVKKPSAYWLCQCDCGNKKIILGYCLRRGFTKSCGCYDLECKRSRRGDKSPQWKGGRIKNVDGYWLLSMRGHANANRRGYVFEHVYIMSNYLDRPLEKHELVHHKNGVKDDNRLDNLSLMLDTAHCRGQTIEDLVPYWVEMIKRYAPEELSITYDLGASND